MRPRAYGPATGAQTQPQRASIPDDTDLKAAGGVPKAGISYRNHQHVTATAAAPPRHLVVLLGARRCSHGRHPEPVSPEMHVHMGDRAVAFGNPHERSCRRRPWAVDLGPSCCRLSPSECVHAPVALRPQLIDATGAKGSPGLAPWRPCGVLPPAESQPFSWWKHCNVVSLASCATVSSPGVACIVRNRGSHASCRQARQPPPATLYPHAHHHPPGMPTCIGAWCADMA